MTEKTREETKYSKCKLTEEPTSKSIQELAVKKEENINNVRNQAKTIYSHELLQEGNKVFILHNGDHYRLRCTRNRKLILTK